MGLAEALSALDGAGFDVTDTGFTIEQVELARHVGTRRHARGWREGRRRRAAPAAANVPRGTSDEPATEKREQSNTGGPLTAAPLVLPCTRGDVEWTLELLRSSMVEVDRYNRLAALLDLPREVLGDDPPLSFGDTEALVDPCEACGGRGYDQRDPSRRCGRCNGAGRRAVTPAEDLPPDVCRRCRLGVWAHGSEWRPGADPDGPRVPVILCADGEPGQFGQVTP
jgi:hypothetical protein